MGRGIDVRMGNTGSVLGRGSPRRARGARAGISLVETLVALVLLVIGLGNVAVTGVRCAALQRSTGDYVQAHNACRNVIEQLQNGSLVTQFQNYSAQPSFAVGDLQVQVLFPEQVLSQALGGPIPASSRFRDMNGDGQLDLNAASTDLAGLLAVRILVTRGTFRFQLDTLLVGS